MEEKIVALIAERVLRGASETAELESLFQTYLSRTDDSPNPFCVVSAIVEAFSKGAALEKTRRPHLVVISRFQFNCDHCFGGFGPEERIIKDLGDQLLQIGVKGGGTGSRFNGNAVGWKDSVGGQRPEKMWKKSEWSRGDCLSHFFVLPSVPPNHPHRPKFANITLPYMGVMDVYQ